MLIDSEPQSTNVGFGGLVADAMGLGKTLTMLTAIFCTLSKAEFWAGFLDGGNDSGAKNGRTKATLVVVPSLRKPVPV